MSAWPPNYVDVFAFRQRQINRIAKNPMLKVGALDYYSKNPIDFINHWCNTYDPRNAGTGTPAHMPFVMFDRQHDLVNFLKAMVDAQENGLIEKARDMGATWVCCAFSVWLWLFREGSSIGWGSRKEQLVDKIGDPDSIFEKMRMIILGLPRFFLPIGFKRKDHLTYMKIINPENGATITGEAGDNIGRGGRKLIYFKDESAHYERPEKIEAALADNTNVQIDISSVNGIGNVFYRKAENGIEWLGGEAEPGVTNLFIMDWSDHPKKDLAWYNKRKSKAEEEGLLHLFAQEVDRSYSSAVEGVIIKAEWIKSAIGAHLKLGLDYDSGNWVGALDVADGGLDKNAFVARKGIVLRQIEEWGARDTGVTARKAIGYSSNKLPIDVQYDCIGVGAGVKSEINRLRDDEKLLDARMSFVPWDAGTKPLNPKKHVIEGDRESPLNDDFYKNLKAQGWWLLARRFEKTHKAVTEGIQYDPDELISLDPDLPLLRTLEKELCQPTMGKSSNLKLLVNKTPNGTKSPNIGDCVMMCYHPNVSKKKAKASGAGSRKF